MTHENSGTPVLDNKPVGRQQRAPPSPSSPALHPSAPMALFAPHREHGLVNAIDGVPVVVRRRGTESYASVSARDGFYVLDCKKLTPAMRSDRLGGRPTAITSLAVRKDWTFCATGRVVRCVKRTRELCALVGTREFRALRTFGHHLMAIDVDGAVTAWDVDDDAMKLRVRGGDAGGEMGDLAGSASGSESERESASGARRMDAPRAFQANSVCHPDGYVDILLFGGEDGRLALVDVRAGTTVREFKGWGSRVTALENSPATDFVAVGLEDGRVLLVNLLEDSVLFTVTPDHGLKITALAFRTDDQDDVLCVGDESGRVTVWDLEKRSLRTVISQCHEGPVVTLKFLDSQPVMLSSGVDNSIKEWIFDRDDGEARLLRFRAGHSKPPTCVSFYGEGKKLLSAGNDRTLRMFHMYRDQQSIELSQKNVGKRAKRIGVNEEELKLPPVTSIASNDLREKDWANVVTAHEGSTKAYTWRLAKGAIGEHVLQCPKEDGNYEIKTTAISACGNYAFVGAANGAVHRFNLQSGLHRGALQRVIDAEEAPRKKKKNGNEGYNFPGGKRSFWALANQVGGNSDGKLQIGAHDGEVTCIQPHCANRSIVTAGVDGFVRVWKFSELKLDMEIDVGCSVRCGYLHEDGLIAVGCGDKHVRVFDTMTGKRVRTYVPRGNLDDAGDVKSVQISAHGRWVLSLDTKGSVRVYDIPAARLLQHMELGAEKVVAMHLSPRMDFLATVHEGHVGVFLWVNQPMFAFKPPKVAYGRKVSIGLPKKHAQSDGDDLDVDGSNDDRAIVDEDEVYVHPLEDEEAAEEHTIEELENIFKEMSTAKKQIEPGMITLANIPETQIDLLLNLETVKERQKLKKEEKEPARAPFFLPTTAASDDVRRSIFDTSREAELNETSTTANGKGDDEAPKSRILRQGADLAGAMATPLLALIRKGEEKGDYLEALEYLRNATPSTCDGEIR